jgi:hypothetical protein
LIGRREIARLARAAVTQADEILMFSRDHARAQAGKPTELGERTANEVIEEINKE